MVVEGQSIKISRNLVLFLRVVSAKKSLEQGRRVTMEDLLRPLIEREYGSGEYGNVPE